MTFQEMKKWALDHLKKQMDDEPKESNAFKKSIDMLFNMMQKSRGLPVGTIREWKGHKYKKMPNNNWVRVYDKSSRGANQAIAAVMRKIEACKDETELYNVIQANIGRFSDKNGIPLPEVEKIHAASNVKKEKLSGESSDNSYGVGEEANKEKNDMFKDKDKISKKEAELHKVGRKLSQIPTSELKKEQEKYQRYVDNKTRNKREHLNNAIFKDSYKEHLDAINKELEKRGKSDTSKVDSKSDDKKLSNGKTVQEMRDKYGIKTDEKKTESEAEKHQNRSDAMKGNQNAKKYGNIDVDDKNLKTITNVMGMSNKDVDGAITNLENEIKRFPNGSNVDEYKKKLEIFKNEKKQREIGANNLKDDEQIPGVYSTKGLNTISKIADALGISKDEAKKRITKRWSDSAWGNDPMKRYLDINDSNGKGWAGIPDFSQPIYDNAVKEVVEDYLADKMNIKNADNDTYIVISEEADNAVNNGKSLKQAETDIKKRINKEPKVVDAADDRSFFGKTNLSKAVQKYANDKIIKSAVSKISGMDFTASDPARAFLAGEFCDKGYKIATNAKMLSMIKSDYDSADEGKLLMNPEYMKFIDKIIGRLNDELAEKESDLKELQHSGTGTMKYINTQSEVEELKKDIARHENIKKTGKMDQGQFNFPKYQKVIPSMQNSELEKPEGFEDFNKLMKISKTAMAYTKELDKQFAPVKVGKRYFASDLLFKCLALAQKNDLTNVVTVKDKKNGAIEFNGDKGSIVLMPLSLDKEPEYVFDSNTGNAQLAEYDKEKNEEFLSAGEKETKETRSKNIKSTKSKMTSGLLTDVFNKIQELTGRDTKVKLKVHSGNAIYTDNGGRVNIFEHKWSPEDEKLNRDKFVEKYGAENGNKIIDAIKKVQELNNYVDDRIYDYDEKYNEHSSELAKYVEDQGKEIKQILGIKKSFAEQVEEIRKSFEDELMQKSRYIRREGTPGHYKYIYKESQGKKGTNKTMTEQKNENKADFSNVSKEDKIKILSNHMHKMYRNVPVEKWEETYKAKMTDEELNEKFKEFADAKPNFVNEYLKGKSESVKPQKDINSIGAKYIAQLGNKAEIKSAIEEHFKGEGYSGNDLQDAVENAMDSKVSDLEEIWRNNPKVKSALLKG